MFLTLVYVYLAGVKWYCAVCVAAVRWYSVVYVADVQ